MTADWNDILRLPDATLAGEQVIHKTQIVLQGNLSKTEEKRLGGVAKLTLSASLQKSNTYMLPMKNEAYDIEAIIILHCSLKASAAPAEIAALLHKVFPNPTIILFDDLQGKLGLSAAVKRKSRAEQGAIVVESIQNSGLFFPDAQGYSSFLDEISFERLPQTDLLHFVDAFSDRIMLSKTISHLGFYPKCKEPDIGTFTVLVKQLESVQSEIAELLAIRRDKNTSLAESSKIRIRIRDKQNLVDATSKRIKELCHE